MHKTVQPRKQRKRAAQQVFRKGLRAHLSKELKKKYKLRSIGIRKGDDVKVVRGEYRGKIGKVEEVTMRTQKIYIEGIQFQKQSGAKTKIGINPSNVIITSIDMKDKLRKEKIERKIKGENK